MNAPVATAAQLLPTVERALKKGRGERRVVLVRAAPDADRVPDLRVNGELVLVRASRSPLEIRALVHDHDNTTTLVVLTDCDRQALGDDLLARVAGREVFPLDRWQSVKDLFGALHISADLSRKRHLADALIEARPIDGYPPVRGKVLDTETAIAALQQAYLAINADVASLTDLVRWALLPEASGRLNRARPDVIEDLRRFLTERFGPGAQALLAIVQQGRGSDLIPLALVGGVVHDKNFGAREAQVRLEFQLPGATIPPTAWHNLAAAAATHLRMVAEQAEAHGWRSRAETLLADLGAPELAWLSDELPAGFTQRLAAAGVALQAWDAAPQDNALAEAAANATDRAAAHRQAGEERITRLRMAARLIRRTSAPLAWGDQLASAAATYQRDGAWLDWARLVVSRSESEPGLAALYRSLTARFDAGRDEDNRRFAPLGATAAQPLAAPLLGVEHVLDEVLGPLATQGPVLLLVLDGMSWPSWVEISGALAGYGWTAYRRADGTFDRHAVAVLPTVTEVSRTSLLCGVLRSGSGESEKRAFTAHPALRHGGGGAPVLWHKAQLRAGGLDRVPADLLADIGNPQQRVVGVVLNNIDERLKDVAQPPEGWGLAELDPLRWILDAARRAGRPVVFTADHGHVLERDGEQITGGQGGERWRAAERQPGDGEIVVHGPRVVTAQGANIPVILPWREKLRYTSRHNGYHGGITPQELFVPLAVLAAEDAVLPGWEPIAVAPPTWWHHQPAAHAADAEPAVGAPRRSRPAPAEPTLFDLDALSVPGGGATAAPGTEPASAGGDWAAQVTVALAAHRSPRVRLSDEQVTRLLRILAAHDGQAIVESRLADLAELPAARIGRYLSQLQELVNIDSYGVLSVLGGEVRFDRALLDRQLGRP